MTRRTGSPPARAAGFSAAAAILAATGCGDTHPSSAGGAGRNDPGAITRAANPGLCAPANAFSYAMCVCEDFRDAGLFVVGTGPSGAGSVGVNGSSTLANADQVAGSWVSYGNWSAGTGARIGADLRSGADLSVAGAVSVGRDVAVRDRLLGAGYLTVGRDLRVGGSDIFLGVRSVAGTRAAFDAPTQPPCGCEPGAIFDVAGAVAQARTQNDNAARGVPAGALLDVGLSKLTLATGRYYFQNVTAIGRNRLEIAGTVSMYIDGNLDQIGYDDIKILPGASLDLYVSGAVRLVGFTPQGNPQSPSSFRLYVGGSDRLSVAIGLQEFFGSIYAPTAEVAVAGATVIVGSLFAKEVTAAGVLTINHGGATPSCTPPAGGGSGGGTPPPGQPTTPAPTPVVP